MKRMIIVVCGILVLSGCVATQKNNYKPTDEEKQMVSALEDVNVAFDAYEAPKDEREKVVVLTDNGSVYYFGADDKRYIFPTPETYYSWFGGYQPEKSMDLEEMQKIPLGGNVTLRPGTLLQTPSDLKVYLVIEQSAIAPVDERVLQLVYGKKYKDRIVELPNYYFTNYVYATPIASVDEFPQLDTTLTIDKYKDLE